MFAWLAGSRPSAPCTPGEARWPASRARRGFDAPVRFRFSAPASPACLPLPQCRVIPPVGPVLPCPRGPPPLVAATATAPLSVLPSVSGLRPQTYSDAVLYREEGGATMTDHRRVEFTVRCLIMARRPTDSGPWIHLLCGASAAALGGRLGGRKLLSEGGHGPPIRGIDDRWQGGRHSVCGAVIISR